MKKLLVIILFLFQSLIVLAHQDRRITLEDNGKLLGLPEHYSNPIFERDTFTLYIGNNCIIIPDCIKSYFEDYTNYEIRFFASWYHDLENLPPYIHMDIVTADEPLGCQILFNLATLEILGISKPKIIIEKQGNLYMANEQEISEDCQVEMANSIAKR